MATEKLYTLRSARDLLGVDGNTLRDWLTKHQIEVISSEADKRIKHITHTQLATLARHHGKTLTTHLNRDRPSGALEQRVEALEDLVEKLRGEVALLRTERRSRGGERAPSDNERTSSSVPLAEREPPAFRPQTYQVKGDKISKGGIGRLAFAHGSANSEEYGRKFLAPKIPEIEQTSVAGVLRWLRTNRQFNECTTDPSCSCHTMFMTVIQAEEGEES